MILAWLLVLIPSLTWSAEVWFRPAGSTYGTGDGTSYANAFAGLDTGPGSSTTATRVAPGDTMHVCGYHRAMVVVLDDNLTIDLACSAHNDPATIDGTDLDNGTGWTLNANGEYQKTVTTAPKVMVLDGKILEPATPGTLTSGKWGCSPQWLTPVCDNSAGPWTIYLKDNPVGRTLAVGARNMGIQLGIGVVPGQGIRSITVLGGGVGRLIYQGGTNWGWGKGISMWSDSWPFSEVSDGTWTIDGVIFIGQHSQGIHTYGDDSTGLGSAPSHLVIRNNQFYDIGGEALYLKSGAQVLSALVENNVIGSPSHTQSGWNGEPGCSSATGDGIDLGGNVDTAMSHVTVRGNMVWNTRGFGISATGQDILIENNLIVDANFRDEACERQAGIAIGQEVSGLITITKNRVIASHGPSVFIGVGASVSGNTIAITQNDFRDTRAVATMDFVTSSWSDGQRGISFSNNDFCMDSVTVTPVQTKFPNNRFWLTCGPMSMVGC